MVKTGTVQSVGRYATRFDQAPRRVIPLILVSNAAADGGDGDAGGDGDGAGGDAGVLDWVLAASS
jgi:hypothetical protein